MASWGSASILERVQPFFFIPIVNYNARDLYLYKFDAESRTYHCHQHHHGTGTEVDRSP